MQNIFVVTGIFPFGLDAGTTKENNKRGIDIKRWSFLLAAIKGVNFKNDKQLCILSWNTDIKRK